MHRSHIRAALLALRPVALLALLALLPGCRARGGDVGGSTTAVACGASDTLPVAFEPGPSLAARWRWRITYTPRGDTAYFAASEGFFPVSRRATIYVVGREGDGWGTPRVASFSGTYVDMDPHVAPDGRRLFFSSIRPVDGQARADLDLWVVERERDGWSAPRHLGSAVNSADDELYASTASDGTLYFASGPTRPQPGAHFDIYAAAPRPGGFAPREALGSGVNTRPAIGGGPQDAWEFNPEISPDGRTLVFTSLRPGGFGLGDLYVSHLAGSAPGGAWRPARNLGPRVNTAADEYHATRTRDGRWLEFVRRVDGVGRFHRLCTGDLFSATGSP